MGLGIPRWEQIRKAVLVRDGYQCRIPGCTMRTLPADSVDHIIPRAYGGGHGVDNLRAAHFRCNARRGGQQRKRHMPRARASRFG